MRLTLVPSDDVTPASNEDLLQRDGEPLKNKVDRMNPSPHPEVSAVRTPQLRRSLTVQLALVVAVTLMVVLTVVLATDHFYESGVERRQIQDHLSAVAASRRDAVETYVRFQQERLATIAGQSLVRQFLSHHAAQNPEAETSRALAEQSLASMDALLPYMLRVRVVDAQGNVVVAHPVEAVGSSAAAEPAFQAGLGGVHLGLPERRAERYEAEFAVPVRYEGRTLGVVLVTADVNPLAKMLRDTAGLGESGEVVLAVRQGDEARSLFPGRGRDEPFGVPLAKVAALAAALEGRQFFGEAFDYRGVKVLAAAEPVGYGGWGLVVKIDASEAYASLVRGGYVTLGLGLAGTLAGLAAAWALTRQFTHPILRLAEAAERVARGDLGVTVPVTSKTEAGELTARFNEMTAALRTRTVEREKAEATLRLSEERFRIVVESAPNGIVMINREGTILLVNAQTEANFGYSRDELLGQSVELLVPAQYRGKHPEHRQGFFSNPQARRLGVGRDLLGVRKDGSEFSVELGLASIETPEGMLVLSTIVDISERRCAEQALREYTDELAVLNESLKQANQELEAFSYSVSHDLRAPLRHVAGFVQLLQKHAASRLDETCGGYLRAITQATHDAGQLVDDLLAFAQLSRVELRTANVALEGLVAQVQTDLAPETGQRIIHWRIADLPQVRGDPSLLRLVLRNLMGNAVKYTRHRDEALIEIACPRADPEEVVFSVHDNGAGFDMRYVDKLFGVFQRLHRQEEFEGTGIGLAEVRRIIHRHGGRTWAEGEIDRGATFYFSLPRG